ncbi:hypothetical protein DFP72DRAFT_825057 [Ephemerocybe angulata]|uniref:F-box domain-containing protein n=1 Tax=Ephemerocybe angulata TaxID=980116 RepID=A0A8H6LY31_9AGAR|nr:hypothetical protein DFP72DRAFT_825057 [Tulosesus angulatus]
MEPRLPLDILTLIPSYLDGENVIRTLKTLCSTSSLFLHPCRTLRFNRITLSPLPLPYSRGTLPGKRLSDLLEASPNLSKYIKELAILDFLSGMDARNESWLVIDIVLPDALHKLYRNQITSFTLKRSRPEPWISLPAATRSALIDICRSTSLIELTIRMAPLSLLSECGPSLKRFYALDAETMKDRNYSPRSRSTAEYIKFDSLHLSHYRNLDQHLAYLVDPSNKMKKREIFSASPGDHICGAYQSRAWACKALSLNE